MRRKANLVDNVVHMLEKYATNLETIVEQRTCELTNEKVKFDKVLYSMMPRFECLRVHCCVYTGQ
jgi:hypothetical protein